MDNSDNTDNTSAVEASVTAGDSEGGVKTVPVENRLAEVNRRLGKIERSIDEKLQMLLQGMQPVVNTPAYAPPAIEPAGYMTKGEYYTHRDSEEYEKLKVMYPELDQASEKFDPDFYKTADMYYQEFANSKSPVIRTKAVEKAIQQAAIDTGKFQQLERSRALADEVKRSRLLGDGLTAPKGAVTESNAIPENVKTLAKMFGIDDKRLKKEFK